MKVIMKWECGNNNINVCINNVKENSNNDM